MMRKAARQPHNTYTDVDPRFQWRSGEDSDTLIVDASGFKKEQMKVLISTSGSLKISGQHPTAQFHKEFEVPRDCDPRGIQAKFDKETGLLYLVMPKVTSHVNSQAMLRAEREEVDSEDGEDDHGELEEEMVGVDGENHGGFSDGDAMHEGHLGMRMNRHKLFILNVMVVASMIIVAVGAYALYMIAPKKKQN